MASFDGFVGLLSQFDRHDMAPPSPPCREAEERQLLANYRS
eukprot:gene17852-48840_t